VMLLTVLAVGGRAMREMRPAAPVAAGAAALAD
jgi:hypothetical protein